MIPLWRGVPRWAVLSAVFVSALPGFTAELHVSPVDGRDTNPGSRARPFATLERARDEARCLRQAGKLSGETLTIWLGGGRDHQVLNSAMSCAQPCPARTPARNR